MGESVEERCRQLVCSQRVLHVIPCRNNSGIIRKLPYAVDFSVQYDVECHTLDAGQCIVDLIEENNMQSVRFLLAFRLYLPEPCRRYIDHLSGRLVVHASAVETVGGGITQINDFTCRIDLLYSGTFAL